MTPGKIRNMLIADPRKRVKPTQTIEETGHGSYLCCEYLFGRVFRHDPDTVREICEEYCNQYNASCEKNVEDPDHTPCEVTNFNDLYKMLSIDETGIGDAFGYTNTKEYSVFLEFQYEYIYSGPMVEKYGEPIFFFGPKQGCEPMECYMEV